VIVGLTCGVIASVSRSAILSYFLIATGSLVLSFRRLPASTRSRIVLALLALFVTVPTVFTFLWNLPATHSKFVAKADELTSAIHGVPLPGTADQRYSFSASALEAFLAKPVLGWGAGGWSTLWHYSDERVVKYPHDFILEIAAEQGLLGLGVLGLLLLAMLRAGVRVLHDQQVRGVFILSVVALVVVGNAVTGQIDDRSMWFFLGMLFALARMSRAGSGAEVYAQAAQ
jgi:O-antigen ligase